MKKIIFSALLLIGVLSACTDNFEETNSNPNLIDQISPGTLLNEVIYNMTSNNLRNYYSITGELMQVKFNYPSFYGGIHRYEIIESTGNSQWNASYKWMKNLKEMLSVSEKPNDANYKAIALTLNAWIVSNLTDTFGDIPYSEASRGDEGIRMPKYDTQQAIYTQLLKDLEQANSLYNISLPMLYGKDILFNNNVEQWQRFTNSLRLRLLLRVSNVQSEAIATMLEILQNPTQYPIVETDEQSVQLNITGVAPNVSPWSRALDFSNGHIISEFFIEELNELNDPRRSVLALPAKDLQGNEIGFKGIPSAYDGEDSQFQYSPSIMNNKQVIAPMKTPILMHSEVLFIKAELAHKGIYNPASAQDYFESGIKSAIKFVSNVTVDDSYFEQDKAKFNNTLEQIILHKYLSLYFTDFQQWSEYRRTGYPKLPKTQSMLNDGVMPSRLMYPSDQTTYNNQNYLEASQRMGGDNINSKVWWNK